MGNPTLPAEKRARFIVAENGAAHRSGTPVANYSYTTSCERHCGWGGARNRADRTSDGLTDAQIADIIAAAQFAMATARTFQRHWTIHYTNAGIAEREAAAFIGAILALAGKQARRIGGKLTALWVRENASAKGGHVHILLHLPADMRLHGLTRRWIETAGGAWRPGVSKVRILGGRLSKLEGNTGEHHKANAANVVRYLLKAGSVEIGEQLGLTRAGKGGRIVGKRWGCTQNINRAARAVFPTTDRTSATGS